MTQVTAKTSLRFSAEGFQSSVSSRVRWAGFPEPGWSFNVGFFLQISTPPTALTSFHIVPRVSWKERHISWAPFFCCIWSVFKPQIFQAAFPLSFLLLSHTLSLCLCGRIPQLWSAGFQNAALILSSSELPLPVPLHLRPVHWWKTQQGRQEAWNSTNEAPSLYPTKWVALWLQNGTFLSGGSSTMKQKEGVRKQTQEGEEEEGSQTVGAPHFIVQRDG